MGKTTVNITNKKKMYVDAKGNTFEEYTDFDNKRMVRPTGSVEDGEKEEGGEKEKKDVRVNNQSNGKIYIKI
jgi:hypothetical protein